MAECAVSNWRRNLRTLELRRHDYADDPAQILKSQARELEHAEGEQVWTSGKTIDKGPNHRYSSQIRRCQEDFRLKQANE